MKTHMYISRRLKMCDAGDKLRIITLLGGKLMFSSVAGY